MKKIIKFIIGYCVTTVCISVLTLTLLTIFGTWKLYRTPGKQNMMGRVVYVGELPCWFGEISRYIDGTKTAREDALDWLYHVDFYLRRAEDTKADQVIIDDYKHQRNLALDAIRAQIDVEIAKMNKTIVFADAHISDHKKSLDRLDDCLKALEWVFKTAQDQNINTVIFAGDLFQDRSKISVFAYQKTFEIFEKYADIECYLLLGNHDLWFAERRDVSSVFPLRALPKVHIIDKPCCLNVLGKNIDFLPYTKNPNIEITEYFQKKSDILITHVAVNGAYLNTLYKTISEVSVEYEGDMIKVDHVCFKDWKKVFSGHYHAAQKLGDNFEYIGSPLQLSFNEVFQEKHIIVLDLDDLSQKYIINDFSPIHLIIKESEINNYDLDGNFVQIIADDLNSSKILDIKKSINKKVSTLEFKEAKSNKKSEIKTDLDNVKKILSDGETIEKYTELMQTKLDKNKLTMIGKDIIKKATVN